MKMKKNEAASLVIVILSLLSGALSLENVYGFINWIIPTSTMQGQEIFLILPLMVVFYIALAWFVARAVWHFVVALVFALYGHKRDGE